MVDVLPDVIAFAGQADWSLARPLPVVTLEIRKAVGLTMLIPAGTLFLLYLFRPRPYVLAGVSAWVAASVRLLVLSVDTAGTGAVDFPDQLVSGRLAIVTWAIAALIFGASLRLAGAWFRATVALPRAFLWTAAGGVAWIGIAAMFLQPAAVLVPAFALMSVWQAMGVVRYWRAARQHRFVGAMMAGIGVTGIIAVNTIAALVAVSQGGMTQAATNVAYLNFVCVTLVMLGMHLLIFEDVIEELRKSGDDLRASRDEMRAVAVTDPLTRCYNRRFLEEIETHELFQHRRHGLSLSLLYIDIDHFKTINDTRGHHAGDTVLQTIANILRAHTRHSDYVLRWGGDEFLVLLSADEASARTKAHDIRQAFRESAAVRDLPVGVDLTIGCVAVPPDTERLAPLIDQADREMYRQRREVAPRTLFSR
jgi:diguanylate cyclase (GGDEF)-like protein